MKTCKQCDRSESDGASFRSDRHTCRVCENVQRTIRAKESREPDFLEEVVVRRRYMAGDRVPKPAGLIVGLFDVHIEEVNEDFWSAILNFLAKNPIDQLVLGGDFMELGSCNTHGGTVFDPHALESDLNRARQAIKALRAACGHDTKITYMEGNHETRGVRMLGKLAPAMASRFILSEELNLRDWNVSWVPEDPGIYEIGNLRIIHGHQLRVSEKAGYPAKSLAEKFGAPGRTTVCGHFHRKQVYDAPHADGVRTAMCIGAVRDLRAGWLHGEQPGWTNQLMIARQRPSGVVDVIPTSWVDGAFSWDGVLYS